MRTQIEDELRGELRRRADAVPSGVDGYGRVMRRRGANRRRRYAATAIGAAAVIAAGAVVVPQLPTGRSVIQPERAEAVLTTNDDPAAWPTRGSLASDEAYLARARKWLSTASGAPVSKTHVLYAGDVGDRRAVVGVAGGETWLLHGPRGSTAALGGSFAPAQEEGLVAFAVPSGAGSVVTAMAAPGTQAAQVSTAPAYDTAGNVSRLWSPLRREDGVFTARVDAPATRMIRARAVTDGTVTADLRSVLSSMPPMPEASQKLRSLVEDATGGRPVRKLANALSELEDVALGPDAITSVEIPWRFTDDRGHLWVGVLARTADGATVQTTFHHSDPANPNDVVDGSPALFDARVVPPATGGDSATVWSDYCNVFGYVPDAVSAEVVVAGEAQPRVPVRDGLFEARACKGADVPAELDGTTKVRLYDASGARVWSGRPRSGVTSSYDTLDVPSTTGQQAD